MMFWIEWSCFLLQIVLPKKKRSSYLASWQFLLGQEECLWCTRTNKAYLQFTYLFTSRDDDGNDDCWPLDRRYV